MIFLSNAALRYAIDVCLEKDKYKVGIAINNEDKRNIISQLILDMIIGSDYIEHIRNSKHNFEICFKNGSVIKFIPVSDSSRMNRLHLLIIDRDVPIDVVQHVLKPCECVEWMEYVYEQRGKII